MSKEINLLKNYPSARRNVNERGKDKTDHDRKIARQFGKDFFDGDRRYGYGGYSYNEKYWMPVIPDFIKTYNLSNTVSILDVGCGKGFMLHDIKKLISGASIRGIDISEYAVENCMPDVTEYIDIGTASKLPYEDNSFDLVLAINTIHNLDNVECKKALQEIERVSNSNSFVTVDAFRTDEERKRMDAWNLTAKTYMSVSEWKDYFNCAGYTGDYYWFIP